MTIRSIAAIAFLFAAACAPETATDPAPGVAQDTAATTLAEALQADRDFAAAVKSSNPETAFRAWIAQDSQFIAAGVVTKGLEEIVGGFKGSPPGFTVEWAPDGGYGGAGGDLAVTTGRYAVKIEAQTIEAGRYSTTWRKQADGVWKVAMEMAVADPTFGAAPLMPQ